MQLNTLMMNEFVLQPGFFCRRAGYLSYFVRRRTVCPWRDLGSEVGVHYTQTSGARSRAASRDGGVGGFHVRCAAVRVCLCADAFVGLRLMRHVPGREIAEEIAPSPPAVCVACP